MAECVVSPPPAPVVPLCGGSAHTRTSRLPRLWSCPWHLYCAPPMRLPVIARGFVPWSAAFRALSCAARTPSACRRWRSAPVLAHSGGRLRSCRRGARCSADEGLVIGERGLDVGGGGPRPSPLDDQHNTCRPTRGEAELSSNAARASIEAKSEGGGLAREADARWYVSWAGLAVWGGGAIAAQRLAASR